MDTLLVNGDHHLGDRGLPVALTGDRELIQRALIRLSVRRGAFHLDPELGSQLHKLRGARPQALERLALAYAREALAPMAEVAVEEAAVTCQGRDGLTVGVTLSHGGRRYPLETPL